jgi:hypothetical protein
MPSSPCGRIRGGGAPSRRPHHGMRTVLTGVYGVAKAVGHGTAHRGQPHS